MTSVTVTLRTGEQMVAQGRPGLSLMETLRDGGVDEILAICGGSCSCATCHVYVEEGLGGRVGPPSADEAALLDFSDYRTERSRLSCQIRLTPELDGLAVTVAPED